MSISRSCVSTQLHADFAFPQGIDTSAEAHPARICSGDGSSRVDCVLVIVDCSAEARHPASIAFSCTKAFRQAVAWFRVTVDTATARRVAGRTKVVGDDGGRSIQEADAKVLSIA